MKFGSLEIFFDKAIAFLEGIRVEISKYLFSDFETIFWAIAITSPSSISIDSVIMALKISSDRSCSGLIRGNVSNAMRFIELIIFLSFSGQ